MKNHSIDMNPISDYNQSDVGFFFFGDGMMRSKAIDYLNEIAVQEKQFDALYRGVGCRFNLPDCPMWILYNLSSTDAPLSQQDLIEKMLFPKQTINSAVMYLARHGWVELQMIPGTRNRKNILLTPSGKEIAQATVVRMRATEERAVTALGAEKMAAFSAMYHEFYAALLQEFQKEGLADV